MNTRYIFLRTTEFYDQCNKSFHIKSTTNLQVFIGKIYCLSVKNEIHIFSSFNSIFNLLKNSIFKFQQ
jgi:hypothetical protein